MKFSCTQENLSEGLSAVSHIATKNTSLPILNNLLIKAEKGGIELSATNLEIGITKKIRGKVEKEGAFSVPARIIAEYLTLIRHDKVTLELEEGAVAIRSENAETRLRGQAVEEFPLIPKVEKKDGITCPGSEFREAVGQVVFAAAVDDARPEISGVLFKISGKTLTLVATDSYRLAERKVTLTKPHQNEVTAIVPVRTLQELLRVLGHQDSTVTVFLTANQILFDCDDCELVSRLIDGQFPDYQQIIPQNYETKVTAKTNETLQAVKATSLFSRPGINDITLTLDSGGRLVLQASNAQVGENKQIVNVQQEGRENTIVFNSRYLLDGLTNLQSQEFLLEITNNASPGVLRPISQDEDYLYIIMPIKQ